MTKEEIQNQINIKANILLQKAYKIALPILETLELMAELKKLDKEMAAIKEKEAAAEKVGP